MRQQKSGTPRGVPLFCQVSRLLSFPCPEYLHSTVRLLAPAARGQVVARRHLVLQAADVGVSGGEFRRRQTPVEYLVNGVLGLQQHLRSRVIPSIAVAAIALVFILQRVLYRDIEDARQRLLHLHDGIILENNDRLAVFLGLLQALRLPPVVVFDRDDRVGVLLIPGDDDRDVQLTRGLLQPVAADAERVDAQRLANGQFLSRVLGLVDALLRREGVEHNQPCALPPGLVGSRAGRSQGAYLVGLRLELAAITARTEVTAPIAPALSLISLLARLARLP